MAPISQSFIVVFTFASLEWALSLHSNAAEGVLPLPPPIAAPRIPAHAGSILVPPRDRVGIALPEMSMQSWGSHDGHPEPQHATAPAGSILVSPRVARHNEDRVGIALPELSMQRWGWHETIPARPPSAVAAPAPDEFTSHLFDVPTALSKRLEALRAVDKSASNFFQTASEQAVEVSGAPKTHPKGEGSGPKHATLPPGQGSEGSKLAAPPSPQVGDVVADPVATATDQGTSPGEPSQVGFVAADKPPPSMSHVLPLPFTPDDAGALPTLEDHVSASIETQEPQDQDEAWSKFTAAEALQGKNRDTEALGTDVTAEDLPAANKMGTPAPIIAPFASVQSLPLATAGVDTAKFTKPAPSVAAPIPDVGFLGRHSMMLLWLLGISCTALVSGLCLCLCGAGFLASFMWERRLGGPIRCQVEELPLCSAAEVARRLPASSGYDMPFSKQISSCQLLRLEARVEGPAAGSASLTTPLTNQACVLYSVAVSRQLHDGISPAPVAFASAGIDFVISLKDGPRVRINLNAEEVSLFDMHRGRSVHRRAFADAPDKWQDFCLTHRAGTEWQTSAQMRADSSSLEFQECALLVGTVATFVGELQRGADGTLTLRPLAADFATIKQPGPAHTGASELWRTSWEFDGCEAGNIASPPSTPRKQGEGKEACFQKVVVSDDTLLLDGASSLISGAGLMLRRLPAKCGGRAMALANLYRSSKRTSAEKREAGLEAHTL